MSRLALGVPSAWGTLGHSVRCTGMAHIAWMWCISEGTSLTRTNLMAGLFYNPKMSRVATPPLMAAANS